MYWHPEAVTMPESEDTVTLSATPAPVPQGSGPLGAPSARPREPTRRRPLVRRAVVLAAAAAILVGVATGVRRLLPRIPDDASAPIACRA